MHMYVRNNSLSEPNGFMLITVSNVRLILERHSIVLHLNEPKYFAYLFICHLSKFDSKLKRLFKNQNTDYNQWGIDLKQKFSF